MVTRPAVPHNACVGVLSIRTWFRLMSGAESGRLMTGLVMLVKLDTGILLQGKMRGEDVLFFPVFRGGSRFEDPSFKLYLL